MVLKSNILQYILKIRFEWNDQKATQNLTKHGVSFDVAITAFDDPFALIAPDGKHSNEHEVREWLIGESDSGVVVVIFTIRQAGVICRIISARRASKRERRLYEANKRLPV